jgi:twitching motility protein PilJ
VGADNRIVVGANSNRTGEFWDPSGVVSRVLAAPQLGAYQISTFINLTDLQKENPPVNRDTPLAYRALQDMRDTNISVGLIRWVVTPVFSKWNSSQCIGVIVLGDVLNGKFNMMSQSVEVLGNGFGMITIDDPYGSGVVSPVVQFGFTSTGDQYFHINIDQYTLQSLSRSVAQSGTGSVKVSIDGVTYSISAKATPSQYINGTYTTASSIGMMIRAYPQTWVQVYLNYNTFMIMSLSFAVLVLDILANWLTLRLFLNPLERLVELVKRKEFEKFSSHLSQVRWSWRFLLRTGLLFCMSVACLVGMLALTSGNLSQVFNLQSSSLSQIKLMPNAFESKMIQMV